eukprot:12498995-Alexandrium_andersonii.AAC.1
MVMWQRRRGSTNDATAMSDRLLRNGKGATQRRSGDTSWAGSWGKCAGRSEDGAAAEVRGERGAS